MNQYAIYDGQKIINVVIAENIEDVTSTTDMQVFECVNEVPWIGWENFNGTWRPPQPYPSWTWENNSWTPPIEKPQDNTHIWQWDEATLSWDRTPLPQPYPSWTLDNNEVWQPPIPEPQDDFYVYFWNEQEQNWEIVPDEII